MPQVWYLCTGTEGSCRLQFATVSGLTNHAGLMHDTAGCVPGSKHGAWPMNREDTALNSVQSTEILVKNYL